MTDYFTPKGGLPPQTTMHTGRAVFKEAYVFIPKGVLTDIVTSKFPNWLNTRAWILAKPLSGFAQTFSQYIMEVSPNGGSTSPDPEPNAESILFVTDGELDLELNGKEYKMREGGYAYVSSKSHGRSITDIKRQSVFIGLENIMKKLTVSMRQSHL